MNDFDPFSLEFDAQEVDEQINFDDGDQFNGAGIYYNMAHDVYHKSPGVNKSKLDLIDSDPSAVKWIENAPVDKNKLNALGQGTFVHCLLGEPGEIDKQFARAPELNLRTNAGKEALAEFQAENSIKVILSHEDWLWLHMLRDSALAHPTIRMIMEAEGTNETAIFWTDPETGLLLKIKPDRLIWLAGRPFIIDWKTTQSLEMFPKEITHRRYHVQEAMYREGVAKHFGLDELPEFWFAPISKTANCGRYPVQVANLPQDWHDDGHRIYRNNLSTYLACQTNNDWIHVKTLTRPRWA